MADVWNRPKLKIPKTKNERIWDIIGYSFFIGAILLLIIVWNSFPEEVPVHYNAFGMVDRWGSKNELLVLPGVGAFLALFMQLLEKFPETHNYPERLNESNAKQLYLNSRRIVNKIKNILLIIFALILVESVSVAMGWGNGFGKWFLPMTIIGMGIPIVEGIMRQRKIK